MMMDATITTIELLCNSLQVGHDTLWTNSLNASFIYKLTFCILLINKALFARVERLELPANGFGDHYSTN
jgi:hypothetical protein